MGIRRITVWAIAMFMVLGAVWPAGAQSAGAQTAPDTPPSDHASAPASASASTGSSETASVPVPDTASDGAADPGSEPAAPQSPLPRGSTQPRGSEKPFELVSDVPETMRARADSVRNSLRDTADRLFTPEPLGFSFSSFGRLYSDLLRLPALIPRLPALLARKARVLGFMGSILVILLLAGLTYSVTGRKKVLARLESVLLPLNRHVPKNLRIYLTLILRLLATLLVPLGFLAAYYLIRAFTGVDEAWFLLIGRLITIWATGAGVLLVIRALFHERMLPLPAQYAGTIHRVLRWITLYILLTTVIFYAAEAFQLNPEYLAMLKVILSLTIVLASLLLIARKKEILSLLPELPYTVYNVFRRVLTRIYTPAMIGTFITGVLWSFGYRELCWFIWTKTWAVAVVIVITGLGYHGLNTLLERWRKTLDDHHETALYFYKGLHSILVFSTTLILIYAVLSLLGIYEPLKRLISFPIMYAGEIPISLWSFIRAGLIIWVFSLLSRIVRGYLDYKVFPLLGVEEGLAYSINTFIAYLLIISGALFALYTIGLDLRVLMVFAGAIGIGIGLGLQNMAANIISGITLIFGQKIRKGDWIQTGDTLGYVKEVSMRVTRVVTRDSIEYLIPNSFLTANTIVNYTLTDPLIRIHIPVGVSYAADPETVRRIVLEAAVNNPSVSRIRKPDVWFTEYGDSAIVFSLLVWIDVRKVPRQAVQSELYFSIFKALAREGIEIPFPQRDIHIRTDQTRNPPETS